MRIYEAVWFDDEDIDRHRSFHRTPQGGWLALVKATTAFIDNQVQEGADRQEFRGMPELPQALRVAAEKPMSCGGPLLGHELHIIPHALEE